MKVDAAKANLETVKKQNDLATLEQAKDVKSKKAKHWANELKKAEDALDPAKRESRRLNLAAGKAANKATQYDKTELAKAQSDRGYAQEQYDQAAAQQKKANDAYNKMSQGYDPAAIAAAKKAEQVAAAKAKYCANEFSKADSALRHANSVSRSLHIVANKAKYDYDSAVKQSDALEWALNAAQNEWFAAKKAYDCNPTRENELRYTNAIEARDVAEQKVHDFLATHNTSALKDKADAAAAKAATYDKTELAKAQSDYTYWNDQSKQASAQWQRAKNALSKAEQGYDPAAIAAAKKAKDVADAKANHWATELKKAEDALDTAKRESRQLHLVANKAAYKAAQYDKTELAKAQSDHDYAQEQYDKAAAQWKQANDAYSQGVQKIADAQKAADDAEAEAAKANQALKDADKALKDANDAKIAANKAFKEAYDEAAAAKDALAKLDAVVKDAQAAYDAAVAKRDEAAQALADAKKALADAEAALAAAKANLADKQKAYIAAKAAYEVAKNAQPATKPAAKPVAKQAAAKSAPKHMAPANQAKKNAVPKTGDENASAALLAGIAAAGAASIYVGRHFKREEL